jgi:simple sugar transport system permease protein
MAHPEPSSQRPPIGTAILNLLPRDNSVLRLLLIVAAIALFFSLTNPGTFPTMRNVRSMAFQSSEIGILAVAIALTMLTGGIDLSVNAVANLCGILAGMLLTSMAPPGSPAEQAGLAVLLALGVAIGVGVGCGLINGLLVSRVNMPPILATLGTMTLFQGIGTGITGGSTIFGIEAFQVIGNTEIMGLPLPLLIFVGAAFLIAVMLSKTRFGFELYMLGANPVAARFSGINNAAVLLRTYAISGTLAAIAGIVVLGRTNSANVNFGGSYVLLAIVIAVLGGVNPSGGAGRIVGVALAVIALQLLSTGLNMLLAQYAGANFFKEFAWGLLLLLVLLGDQYFARRRQSGGGRSRRVRE